MVVEETVLVVAEIWFKEVGLLEEWEILQDTNTFYSCEEIRHTRNKCPKLYDKTSQVSQFVHIAYAPYGYCSLHHMDIVPLGFISVLK